jgi:hypothetical protein
MDNTSIVSADRTTHLKVVAVSLVASLVVVMVGIAARPSGPSRTVSHITASHISAQMSAPPQIAPVENNIPVKRSRTMIAARETSGVW